VNLNLLLIQLVALSCIFLLLRSRHLPKGWVMVAGGILVVLAGTWLWMPTRAGWISGGLWLGLILLPLLGFGQVNRFAGQERFTAARRLAGGIRWLHPLDGLLEYPHLLRGLELAHQGDLAAAKQVFDRYQTSQTTIGRSATALLYRTTGQWEELLGWLSQLAAPLRWRETTLGILYVRALGETGNLNGLLQAVEQFSPQLEQRGDTVTLNTIRLFALAFCGRVEPVKQLLAGSWASYSPAMQQFWLATAALAAGEETARAQLLALRDRSPAPQKIAIDRRLAQSQSRLDLTDTAQQTLDRLTQASHQDQRYNLRSGFNQPKPATKALIGLNLVMFYLEIVTGGSENAAALYRLGAMIPAAVFAGEWWRLLNGTFLHFGPIHLLMNMVSLYYFGAFVEPVLGWRKFVGAYLFSGVGSMLVAAWLALGQDKAEFFVGASGAIMGLLGVMAVILWQGWRRDRAKTAGQQLRFVLLIMALQTITDLMNPQISIVGHLSGFGLGIVAGSVLTGKRSKGSAAK
jgi:rhomboid protease GluP